MQALNARLSTLVDVPVLRCEVYTDEPLFLTLWDGTEEYTTDQYGARNTSAPVTIGYVKEASRDQFSQAANAMLGELEAALYNNDSGQIDTTLNGLVDSMTLSDSEIDYPEPGERKIALAVTVTIEYSTLVGNPCQQPTY
ncbi:MAG: hypothetical protein ACPGF7_09560 [Pontibacterium sp.]